MGGGTVNQPSWRRPRRPLGAEEVARLVHMREAGATWREIGRAFGKQEGACKTIFDKARGTAPSAGPAA